MVSCVKQFDANGSKQISLLTYGADGLRRKMHSYGEYVLGGGGGFGGLNSGETQDIRDAEPGQLGVMTHYGYDGTNVVREWEENGAGVLSISATYLLGPSGPMYKRPSVAADVRWYVYDGLGSVVGEVDVSGTMLATKKHDVYGVSRGNTGTAKSKHGFVGSLGHYSDDETGLIYMRARYYDPAIGRFISQDPALDGFNWFAYCGNDPVNKVDSNGKEESDVNWAGGALFAIIAVACGYSAVALSGWEAGIMAAMGIAALLASIKYFSMALEEVSSLKSSAVDPGSSAMGSVAFATMACKGAAEMWEVTKATGRLGTYAGAAGFAVASAVVGYSCAVYAAVLMVNFGY